MPVIQTKVDRSSDDFEKNKKAHEALAKDLREVDYYVMQGGPERSREKHHKRGKLLARERIRGLLDEGAHFLEIGRQAAWQVYSDDVPSAGIVIGIGRIQRGVLKPNQQVAVVDRHGNQRRVKVLQVMGYLGLERVEVESAEAGDIVCITE